MAWKIERWLSEVFPGEAEIYSEYRSLSSRELAIVSAAVLDVALAELLSLRLANQENEVEEFLGVNGDGRAPAGSFGARIQLGLLVDLLTVMPNRFLPNKRFEPTTKKLRFRVPSALRAPASAQAARWAAQ